ncbi:MAG: DUF4124 domain-containing protein [Gammaproteobacteria bacterium]|nr:DUF4124 domain-containing protein [Gammaproteobacteria bacterium]MDH3559528.1 DUF4124 domain-containing protein [Gammaproteobacteria bacterium]
MLRGLALTAVLVVIATTSSAAGKHGIYKWVDESGTVQYTQTPPPGREAQELKPPPTPADDPDEISDKLKEQVDAMDQRRTEKHQGAADAQQWAEIQKIRRENCATARANLAKLQQGGNRAYRTPDGQVVRLTEEDRQQRIEATNRQIQENCSPPASNQGQ